MSLPDLLGLIEVTTAAPIAILPRAVTAPRCKVRRGGMLPLERKSAESCRPPPALSYRCVVCAILDSSGTSGPGYLVEHAGGYGARCDWHCRRCSHRVWREYLVARVERMALVRLSWLIGRPATRAELAAHRRGDDTQIEMEWR